MAQVAERATCFLINRVPNRERCADRSHRNLLCVCCMLYSLTMIFCGWQKEDKLGKAFAGFESEDKEASFKKGIECMFS